jgi:hypothetical protein
MAAPPKAIARDVAQGIADLLTAQTFSQNFVASREWLAVNDTDDMDRFLVQVVPEDRRTIERASRGTDKHSLTVNVSIQKRLTGKNEEGAVAPVKQCDAAADFCQEIEDFLIDPVLSTITVERGHATPQQAEAVWDKERLETQGIFAVNVAVAYLLLR